MQEQRRLRRGSQRRFQSADVIEMPMPSSWRVISASCWKTRATASSRTRPPRAERSSSTAILDYDNDGRMDVLLTALADRPFLLRNRCPLKNHWLTLRLEGTRSNRSGYGALITLTAGDLTLRGEALCPTGFLSQGDARPHFGLGTHAKVDRLEIRWPSGCVQVLTNIASDQILRIQEPKP
jgi:hypothetical protein